MFLNHCSSGEKIPAEIVRLPAAIDLTGIRARFAFGWGLESGHEIYALRVVKHREIVGLMALRDVPEELRIEIVLLENSKENIGKNKTYEPIAGILIAFACRLAFSRGYFGFVSLTPKTRLIEYYKTMYGFKQYGRQLAVDLTDAQHLIDRYLNYDK